MVGIIYPQILNEFITDFQKKIHEFLKSYKDLRYTGPTLREVQNNLTISYNIYPSLDILDDFYEKTSEIVLKILNKFSIHGELICYKGSEGEIIDQGIVAFNILKANHYEFYIYKSGSFIYCRLLKEFDPLQKKTWISIDLDIIEKSAWFKED